MGNCEFYLPQTEPDWPHLDVMQSKYFDISPEIHEDERIFEQRPCNEFEYFYIFHILLRSFREDKINTRRNTGGKTSTVQGV